MTAFTKFYCFVEDLANGLHDLGSDALFVALTNTQPLLTDSIFADITEIAGGTGYTAGGEAAAFVSGSQALGLYRLILADPTTWTAAGGAMGPLRWAVLYNSIPVLQPLIGFWDRGSGTTIQAGGTFKLDLSNVNGVLTLQ